MAYFPMMVNITGKPVLLVGGGKEGLQKIEVLSMFYSKITLISPDAFPEAAEKADIYHNRSFVDSDLLNHSYSLVVAATDNRKVNMHISELARKKSIPVNVVDDIELCTFIFPAIVKDEDIVCAISSSGKCPYIVQYLKRIIKGVFPTNIGRINVQMGEYREYIKKEIKDSRERKELLRHRLDELLGNKIDL